MTELNQTTLNMYGANLPIGLLTGNPPTLSKGFSFKPYRMIEEKLIDSEITKMKAKTHPAKAVLAVLKVMLKEYAGMDMSSMDAREMNLTLTRAPMTDILYAYISLRVEALGEEWSAPKSCGACSTQWRWTADLNELELTAAESQVEVDYELRHPLNMGDKQIEKLRLTSPKWGALTSVKQNATEYEMKRALLISSVDQVFSGGEWTQVAIPSHLFDQLTKRDMESLMSVLDKSFPSINLSVETECPNCGHVEVETITWQHTFMFSGSSLPSRQKS